MMPTVYEVRYCASTLYAYGIGSAIYTARLLSDEHERAEIHAGGVLVAVYVRGERAGTCCHAGRATAVWPAAGADDVTAVLRAAVARRDRTGVTFAAAVWVEAVLARDAATER